MMLLDRLHTRGDSVCLIERQALGCGQTIQSQGIIHGGLKYALGGRASAASRAVRDMPDRWRAMLAGQSETDLRGVTLRAPSCHVWSTGSATSLLGLMGAKLALRTDPKKVSAGDRPDVLRDVSGQVLTMAEPVLEPTSMLQVLADRHTPRLHHADISEIAHTHTDVMLTTGDGRKYRARQLVLTAGGGNGALRTMAGLGSTAMQTRPLRMVLARNTGAILNGHCIRRATPFLTITSTTDTQGRIVWQIGGDVAERGNALTESETIEEAIAAIRTALPGVNINAFEWATYEAPRAEHAVTDGHRPDLPGIVQEGVILTAWPTKLALAPLLVDELLERIPQQVKHAAPTPSTNTPPTNTPPVATPPWEEIAAWSTAPSARPA